jgi:hypothetical protein
MVAYILKNFEFSLTAQVIFLISTLIVGSNIGVEAERMLLSNQVSLGRLPAISVQILMMKVNKCVSLIEIN